MFRGISAICKQYEKNGFKGSLRFSVSEKDGIQNIDLCEDTTGVPGANIIDMENLQAICERLKFGWVSVYFGNEKILGFDYKINIQGNSYQKLVKECKIQCSTVKIVAKKSNT